MSGWKWRIYTNTIQRRHIFIIQNALPSPPFSSFVSLSLYALLSFTHLSLSLWRSSCFLDLSLSPCPSFSDTPLLFHIPCDRICPCSSLACTLSPPQMKKMAQICKEVLGPLLLSFVYSPNPHRHKIYFFSYNSSPFVFCPNIPNHVLVSPTRPSPAVNF